jgi:hypothetical protein
METDGLNTYLNDGEGRICATQQVITGIATLMTQYLYDADGNRLAKGALTNWSQGCNTATNGFVAQTAYVLGPHGEQMTELTWGPIPGTKTPGWQMAHTNVSASGLSATYDADLSNKTAGALYFHLSDWLGTRRQQTDYAGNPVLKFTGLPYGDGLTTIPVSNTDAADATPNTTSPAKKEIQNQATTTSVPDTTPARWAGSCRRTGMPNRRLCPTPPSAIRRR